MFACVDIFLVDVKVDRAEATVDTDWPDWKAIAEGTPMEALRVETAAGKTACLGAAVGSGYGLLGFAAAGGSGFESSWEGVFNL